MLATNRYADVDTQLDTQLLEGFRKDNDIGNYEYYDEEQKADEDGGSVEPREISDAVGRINSVGKDETDFGEAKRPVQPQCMSMIEYASNHTACFRPTFRAAIRCKEYWFSQFRHHVQIIQMLNNNILPTACDSAQQPKFLISYPFIQSESAENSLLHFPLPPACTG